MKKLYLFVLFAVLFSACGGLEDDNRNTISNTSNEREIFNYHIQGLSALNQPAMLLEPEQLNQPITNQEGEYTHVTTKYRAAPGYNEHICLDPASDVIWPGSIIIGNSINTGEYIPVAAKRGPATISISLANLKGTRVINLKEAKLSSFRESLGEILSQNIKGSTPALISFTIEEVRDESRLDLAIGTHFGSAVHSIKGQFDFKNREIKSRILVKFIQVYYTLDIDIPEKPSNFFHHSSQWKELKKRISGASPVYVSSISYGRMALFAFESSSSIEELKTAVQYAYSGIIADAGVSLDTKYKSILNSSSIKAFILGGNGGQAVGAVNGFDGLKTYLLEGGNYSSKSPASPLSYKLRYLSNNALCSIVLAVEYEIIRTYKTSENYMVSKFFLRCDSEDDAGDKAEFYGRIYVDAFSNSVPIQGYMNGMPRNNLIWNVPDSQSGNWSLGAEQTKTIDGSISFLIKQKDLDNSYIRVGGWIKEDDTFSDDNLGENYTYINTSQISDTYYYVTGFINGGTSAKIGFKILRQ